MRDWFAAFAPDQNAAMPETWATRATRATETPKARRNGNSDSRQHELDEGNKRATRATEAHTDLDAEHPVAPVAQVLPKPKQSSKGARSPETQGSAPAVAHVAHVAHENDELQHEGRNGIRTAEHWRAYFRQRARVIEQDHGLSRQAAESRAFDFTVIQWLNRNPRPSDPGHCAWCAVAETSGARIVPYGANQSGHVWLHPACWLPWHDERRQSAISALAAISICKPRTDSR